MLSDLYGKQIISNTGRIVGVVEDLVLDFETGSVASLLIAKIDDLTRGEGSLATKLAKNSVKYGRVKSIQESIIVSEELPIGQQR
jgi:sporulation protein YlmC with PRC-barrel domain